MKTTTVIIDGQRVRAYADRDRIVRVYDPIAGHYTVAHSLTPGQVRRVIRLTAPLLTVTAGSHSTELGTVGRARTLLAAKRIGRKAVRESLPNGEGGYRVWDANGRTVAGGSRDIRTSFRWTEA